MMNAQAGQQDSIVPAIAKKDANPLMSLLPNLGPAKQMTQDSREDLNVEEIRKRPKDCLEKDRLRFSADAKSIEEGDACLLEKGEDVHNFVYCGVGTIWLKVSCDVLLLLFVSARLDWEEV